MATRDVGSGPVLGTPDDYPDRPKQGGRLVVHVVIGLLVAIIAGGWGYVMWSMTGSGTGVTAQVVSFTVAPDHAQIVFTVQKPDDRGAVCRVRALDVSHTEVGAKDVRIAPDAGGGQIKERLATSVEAASVHIQYCNLV
ncbi:DUF4307 domain-containing protein [Nonomuraea lactucae]|uniref:DUF4307 domain-containing protein n=1 Tax=Nonomuraea lactucae TaxID=2249762 RepID=UPI000DE2AF1D|nr:DUF4307 domain-containing protein [Nonomuraea lactucae]